METQLALEPEDGYLQVTLRGRHPSRTYPELLRSIRDEATRLGLYKILVDGRGLAAPPSEMDRFQVGVAIAELFGQRFKIAIVYRPELINKFVEDVAVNRGADLLVVGDEVRAIEWLAVARK